MQTTGGSIPRYYGEAGVLAFSAPTFMADAGVYLSSRLQGSLGMAVISFSPTRGASERARNSRLARSIPFQSFGRRFFLGDPPKMGGVCPFCPNMRRPGPRLSIGFQSFGSMWLAWGHPMDSQSRPFEAPWLVSSGVLPYACNNLSLRVLWSRVGRSVRGEVRKAVSGSPFCPMRLQQILLLEKSCILFGVLLGTHLTGTS